MKMACKDKATKKKKYYFEHNRQPYCRINACGLPNYGWPLRKQPKK